MVREFLNPHVSRSGLDRCLRRHGVGNLRDRRRRAERRMLVQRADSGDLGGRGHATWGMSAETNPTHTNRDIA